MIRVTVVKDRKMTVLTFDNGDEMLMLARALQASIMHQAKKTNSGMPPAMIWPASFAMSSAQQPKQVLDQHVIDQIVKNRRVQLEFNTQDPENCITVIDDSLAWLAGHGGSKRSAARELAKQATGAIPQASTPEKGMEPGPADESPANGPESAGTGS